MVCPTFTPLFNLLEKKFKNSHCRTSEEKIPEFTYSQTSPTDSSDKLTPPGTTGGGGIFEVGWPNLLINSLSVTLSCHVLKRPVKIPKENQNWVWEKKDHFPLCETFLSYPLFFLFLLKKIWVTVQDNCFFWCRTTNLTAFSIHLLSEL